MSLTPARCRSCDAAIFYAKTEKGKTIPVDWGVNDVLGNLEVTVGPPTTVRILKRGETVAYPYVSHFATCPQAARWRTKAAAK